MKKSLKIVLLILASILVLFLCAVTYYFIVTANAKLDDNKLINLDKTVSIYDSNLNLLEENAKNLSNVSLKFSQGLSNEDILRIALEGIEYDLFDELEVEYKCDCSRERTERALVSVGKKECDKIFEEQKANGEKEVITLECNFCNKKYEFDKENIARLFKK